MASKWSLFRAKENAMPLPVDKAHAMLLEKCRAYLQYLDQEVVREYNKTEWANTSSLLENRYNSNYLPIYNGKYLKDLYPKLDSAIHKQCLVANLMDALNGVSRHQKDLNYEHIKKYLNPSNSTAGIENTPASIIEKINRAKDLINTYGAIKEHRDPTLGKFIDSVRKFFYSILEKISPGVLEEYTPLEHVSFTKSKGEKFVAEFNSIESDIKIKPH